MNEKDLWEHQRGVFRRWVAERTQDQLFDLLCDVILSTDACRLSEVKDIIQDALKNHAKKVQLLYDKEAFAKFMQSKW